MLVMRDFEVECIRRILEILELFHAESLKQIVLLLLLWWAPSRLFKISLFCISKFGLYKKPNYRKGKNHKNEKRENAKKKNTGKIWRRWTSLLFVKKGNQFKVTYAREYLII